MKLSYTDVLGDRQRHEVDATVTTNHSASSYGIPVIVLPDGEALSIASWMLMSYQVEQATPQEFEMLSRALSPYADLAPGSRLTTAEAAVELGITQRRVQALIATGQLPATRIGRQYMISRVDLELARERPPVGRPPKESKMRPEDPTSDDLWDMFAPDAEPAGILRQPIEQLAQQIHELRADPAAADGSSVPEEMGDEEIALAIVEVAGELEYQAWLAAGSPTPDAEGDPDDGQTRPSYWLMDWREWR